MNINRDSIIELRLSMQKLNNDSYIIGNINTNIFLEAPKEIKYVLEFIDGKNTLGEVEKKLEYKYNLNIDIINFIQELHEQNLVYSIDGQIIGNDNEVIYTPIVKKIANIFFNSKMHLFYLILIFFNIFLIFSNNNNLPNYHSSEIIPSKPGLSLLLFFIISWCITCLHETGHFLAAVNQKIPVKIKLSLRLFFLVVESDINGVWAIKKNNRYICYLAGIYIENLILCIVLITKKFLYFNFMYIQISNAIILIIFINFIWQFMIFLRTDFYLIILNFCETSSIHDVSIKALKEKILLKKSEYSLNNKNILYIFIYILGFFFSIIYYIFNILIYITLLHSGFLNLNNPNKMIALDNFILLLMFLLNLIIWCIGFYNKIKVMKERDK